jgi:hypothetical protein
MIARIASTSRRRFGVALSLEEGAICRRIVAHTGLSQVTQHIMNWHPAADVDRKLLMAETLAPRSGLCLPQRAHRIDRRYARGGDPAAKK